MSESAGEEDSSYSQKYIEDPDKFEADLIENIRKNPGIFNNKSKNKNVEQINKTWELIANNLEDTGNLQRNQFTIPIKNI